MSVVFPAEIPTAGWPIAAVAAAAGIASTAAWLASWAVSGRAWPAYVGIAVAPAWAMAQLAATPAAGASHRQSMVLAGALPAAVALAVLMRGVRAPQVDTGLRPGRAMGLALGALGVIVGVGVYVVRPSAVLEPPDSVLITVGIVTSALWLAAGATCLRRTDARELERLALGVAMFALSLGAIDRALGSLDTSSRAFGSWATVSGRTVAFVGWVLLLLTAVRSLADARGVARRRQESLRDARDEIVRGLHRQQRWIEERRHDLRSLIAGIQSATATLTQYREFLDPHEQELLESALLAEINRLQRSIGSATTRRAFSLTAAIEPVLTSERAQGARIEAQLEDVDVIGDADATAAVVQNLLTNARRHAPAATVRLTAVRADDDVRLAVSDDGPGLPPHVRERIRDLFARGRAADDAVVEYYTSRPGEAAVPVHGLGLAICARLAAEEGARLRLADTALGTRVELLLPVAVGSMSSLQPSVVG